MSTTVYWPEDETPVIMLGNITVTDSIHTVTSDTVTLPAGTTIRKLVNGVYVNETLINPMELNTITFLDYIESQKDGNGEWGYIGVDSFPINDCAKVAGVFECHPSANEIVQLMGYLVDSGYHESLSVLGSYNATSQSITITPRKTTSAGLTDGTGIVTRNISGDKWYCEAIPLNEPFGAIPLGLFATRASATSNSGAIANLTWRQNTGTTSEPRLYSLAFYDAHNIALYDFRPCKIKQNGVYIYGLFDIVNKKFYKNTNTNGGIITGA